MKMALNPSGQELHLNIPVDGIPSSQSKILCKNTPTGSFKYFDSV
jgi:hypothetical protein